MLNFRKKKRKTAAPIVADDLKNATHADAELTELSAVNNPKRIDRARDDAHATISDAAVADIRSKTLIKKGRCPACNARITDLLYTAVCPDCGWSRQNVPDGDHCRVVLQDDAIVCDRTISIKNGQLLCIRDAHVISQVDQSRVLRIDYQWEEDDLQVARDLLHKQRTGICSWCEARLDQATSEPAAPYDEYVAFGAFQEHYAFCSLKCLKAFRRQYPVRVHRNCYETDCPACDQCIKRYDVKDFKRVQTGPAGSKNRS